MRKSKFITVCRTCGEEREVSRTMKHQIKNGVGLNCQSCSLLGNKHRLLDYYPQELYKTRLYRIWSNMKTRCNNKNSSQYSDYGGRGIKVCAKWQTFAGFLDDMQAGYSDELQLDRIDNNGNYQISNCKWSTRKEQCRNTRRNRKITFNSTTKTLQEWSDIVGIERRTISARLDRGWSPEKTLTNKTKGYING